MNNKKLIRSFYRNLNKTHKIIHSEIKIKNINDQDEFSIYFFNRLMILFFLEREGYLNKNKNFLEDHLNKYIDENKNFYVFFKKLCFNYIGENTQNNFDVPYISGNFFNKSEIDEEYRDIKIKNITFKKILELWNKYNWSLKETKLNSSITPRILGKIFEKYVNQKQMGAYYTDKDTTNYIVSNVIGGKLIHELKTNGVEINIDEKDLIEKNFSPIVKLKELIKDPIILKKTLKILLGDKDLIPFSILDPTCGSGAFMFSAIDILENILEEIYTYLLKQKDLIEDKYLKMLIKDIKKHRNIKFYIIKHLVVNNLFGVDIEKNAVEILKLRIYLKLLSVINNKNEIEKIPDLDNNFVCGNALSEEKIFKNNKIRNGNNFKWEKNFKNIVENGGFDCIIGNPPYVEYRTIKKIYKVEKISVLKCNNLYAFIIERSMQLLKENGMCGMIVPISIVSTPRMEEIRKFLYNNSEYIFYSNFADRPGCLFKGVHQKLTIFMNKKKSNNKSETYTTTYRHWYSGKERRDLFNKIKYRENNFLEYIDKTIFKIGSLTEESILKKVLSKRKGLIKNFDNKGGGQLFLNKRLTFWNKCFLSPKKSNAYKKIVFQSKIKAEVIMAIINSNIFFMIWEIISDNWHITNKELEIFKFDYDELSKENINKISKLAIKLEKDLEKKKVYIGSKQVDYKYVHKKSKKLIDKIDDALKDYYEFNSKELEFIKNYKLNYRMGNKRGE